MRNGNPTPRIPLINARTLREYPPLTPEYPPYHSSNISYQNPHDPISYLCAWLALAPQTLCVIYVTLIWSSREVEILLMFAGQMGCEALNFLLKRLIKEERPKRTSDGCFFKIRAFCLGTASYNYIALNLHQSRLRGV